MTEQLKVRTPEEIEALKKNWLADPIWNIEHTEGFEAHYEELKAYHDQVRAEWDEKRKERDDKRVEKVMFSTGVGKADRETLLSLYTFEEVSRQADHYERMNDSLEVSITATLVRATLLQAAQLKRIADALESMADGDSLSDTVRIWGSGK